MAWCDTCGLIRRLNVNSFNVHALYTEGTKYHDEVQRTVGHEPYADRFEHDLSIASLRWPKLMAQYRLLDVGCANGAFLDYAKSQGMDAEGIEPNDTMAGLAHARTGCVVHRDWGSVMGQFDVITYHDVIEHVVDPQYEFELASSYLAPGGLLILDTPDADSDQFAELGMAWHHMRPLQHLWLFREEDLEALCEQNGLTHVHTDRPIPGKLVLYARNESYEVEA